MRKKLVLLTIVAVAAMLFLAACNRGNGGAGAAGDFDFAGYPMDAEDVTVTFWLAGGPALHPTVATWQESPFHSGLNEHVGVNIEWMFPPAGAEHVQEFNLLIASGDLPDIMFIGQHIMNDAELLIDEGVIQDLTPYIADWAPNYHAFLHENPARVRAMRTDSGRYFGFGFFREDGGWNDSFQGPLIRQDWLDDLGLPTPTTISDWDTTLRAFNNEFGATFVAPWSRFDESGNIAGAFGAQAGTRFRLFVDNNNQVQLGNILPEWAEYLAQMAIWWNDGLIDQDLLNAVDADVRSKALLNSTGLAYSSMGQLSGWILDANSEGTGSDWVGLQYPTGDDGTLSMVFGGPGIGNAVTSITTNVGPDRMEIVMRLLDFAYSPEGFMYWNFGAEGVSWNMVDGVPTFSDLLVNDPDGIHGAMERHVGSVWNGPTIQATNVLVARNQPAAIQANDTWYWPNVEVAERFQLPRGMALNAEESLRAGELGGAITTYIEEMAVRFLTGAEPISNFDAFVATVESLGSDEWIALHQSALDRFLAR